ncbi:hypothetical protein [Actinomyces capricornis]|uniref:hypothetical protein n=1 Tax=Actinomyces capricornis TaxID=2755559 RepID=UPI001CC72239|nr:hypothetical protein [Actinomyces capricornis]
MVNSAVLLSVGLAVVQVALRAGGQAAGADLVGDASGLIDRMKQLQPNQGARTRAGQRVAEDIAKAIPLDDPDYRDISETDWELASSYVAELFRGLADEHRRRAGYDWEQLRSILLGAGGHERREKLEQASAKVAFDRVLETACRRAVECLTDAEALRLILDCLEETGDILSELRDRPVEGQLVDQVIADHNEKIRSLTPEELKDREEEMEELRRFVKDGSESWLAYEARMLSGKTALMATFAKNPPEGVRVVSYFVRKNEAGHGRNNFVFVIMAQLANILGDRYVRSPREEEQQTALARALRFAASFCENEGKVLVLLIDGLDEDVYFERTSASGAASILSVFPRSLPRGVRVVTASRPNPPVPGDVICTDREVARVAELTSSPHAEASISPEQLREFFGARMGLPVGAFLAACEGALTARDLCGLLARDGMEVSIDEVESFVGGSSGRLLHPLNVGWEGKPVPAYQLGHDVVLREVLRRLQPDRFGEGDDPEDEQWWADLRVEALESHRHLIIEWMWDLVDRSGWSRETPSYALGGGYQEVVKKSLGDVGVLELLADRSRNEEIVRRYGSAYRSLHAIDEACESILVTDATKLSERVMKYLLSVAEERKALLERNVYIPGMVEFSVEFLGLSANDIRERIMSTTDLDDRAKMINEIFRYSISTGWSEEIHKCLFEAVLSSVPAITGYVGKEIWGLCNRRLRTSVRASLFACLCQYDKAEEIALAETDPELCANALVDIARMYVSLRRETDAQRILKQAESAASESNKDSKYYTLIEIAEVLADLKCSNESLRLLNVVEQEMSIQPVWYSFILVNAAEVLIKLGRADEALNKVDIAKNIILVGNKDKLKSIVLSRAAVVLIELGRRDHARPVLEEAEHSALAVDGEFRCRALLNVAWASAKMGCMNDAERLAGQAKSAALHFRRTIEESFPYEVDKMSEASELVGVAEALINGGYVNDALKVLRLAEPATLSVSDLESRLHLQIDIARMLANVRDVDKAVNILKETELATENVEDFDTLRISILVDVANAFADLGLMDDALRVTASAKDAIQGESDPLSKVDSLLKLATIFFELDRGVDAVRTLNETINEAWDDAHLRSRVAALVGVMTLMTRIGNPENAEEMANMAEGTVLAMDDAGWQQSCMLADVAEVFAQINCVNDAIRIAKLARKTVQKEDFFWQAASRYSVMALGHAVRALNNLGECERAKRFVQSEFRSVSKFATRLAAAEYCGNLALVCLESMDASESDSRDGGWRILASQFLVRSWMLGASVWERFNVLMKIYPDLAIELVQERFLSKGFSGDDPGL